MPRWHQERQWQPTYPPPPLSERSRRLRLRQAAHRDRQWICWVVGLICLAAASAACGSGDTEAAIETVENPELIEERDSLRTQLGEATNATESAHAAASELQGKLDETFDALTAAEAEASHLRSRLDEAEIEIYSLRVTYEEEIRATVQAEIDAEVARACAQATEDLEAPIARLIDYDLDWAPIIDQAGLRAKVRDCAEPAREQAIADALAALQSQIDQEIKRACEQASQEWQDPVRNAVAWNDEWSSLTDRDALVSAVSDCAERPRERAESNAEANRLAECESGQVDSIVKDPQGRRGDCVVVYALIFQFDSVTGRCTFFANMSDRRSYQWWDYDHAARFTMISSECDALDDIDQDDYIKVWASVSGPHTYTTVGGGTNTVPSLSIQKIELQRKG